MPGCFLDEIGHRRFRVQEGHVTSGLTSEKLGGGGGGLLCAVRTALLIHTLILYLSFSFFHMMMNDG